MDVVESPATTEPAKEQPGGRRSDQCLAWVAPHPPFRLAIEALEALRLDALELLPGIVCELMQLSVGSLAQRGKHVLRHGESSMILQPVVSS